MSLKPVPPQTAPDTVRGATAWLQEICASMSLGSRAEATMILKLIGETVPVVPQDLTLISGFQARPIAVLPDLFEESPMSTGYLRDTFDADTLTIAFEMHISCLADAAGMDRQNVLRRVYDICMDQGFDAISEEAERALRSKLDAAQLRLTFQRLRSRVVGSAIHQAAAELVDAGKIAAEEARNLLAIIRTSDPDLLTIVPTSPPAEVPQFDHPDPFDGNKQDWKAECDAGAARLKGLICREVDAAFVLAESSTFTAGRDGGSEVRCSNLWIGHSSPKDHERLLPADLTSYATRYPQVREPKPVIAVRHVPMLEQHGSQADWIALNANAADELGMLPNSDRLFGWTDGSDEVWALRWQNGSPLVSPHNGSCAAGWLLLGTHALKVKLVETFGTVHRCCRITRSFDSTPASSMKWSEDI